MTTTEKVPVDAIKIGDRIRAKHEGEFVVTAIQEFPKTRRFRGYNGWACIVEKRRSSTVAKVEGTR